MSKADRDPFASVIIEASQLSELAVARALRCKRTLWGALFPFFDTSAAEFSFHANVASAYHLISAAAAARCKNIRFILIALENVITQSQVRSLFAFNAHLMVKRMMIDMYGRCDYDRRLEEYELDDESD